MIFNLFGVLGASGGLDYRRVFARPLRVWRSAEQSPERFVNDARSLLIAEGDGTAQDTRERGNHGGPRRRVA